jgi:hypothetical protein
MSEKELTVISVYHHNLSKGLIELNRELAERMNPSQEWIWLVGDNSPSSLGIQINKDKFKIVPNVDRTHFPEEKYGPGWPSHHHASALNKCATEIRTRFALFLDNDFFVIRPEWVGDTMRYMQENNIAFLGAPYYPRDYCKFRYFPGPAFCLFVDLEKIPVETLDFTPEFDEGSFKKISKQEHNFLPLFNFGVRRRVINTSHDTGYKLYKRYYKDDSIKHKCITPVYDPLVDLKLTSRRGGFLVNRLFEYFLPERLCYFPKRHSYYSTTGFRELGYYDARGRGWEEHVWQGKPFGFHIHETRRQKSGLTDEEVLSSIRIALNNFNT